MSTKHPSCPEEQGQEKAIMRHADALARELGIDTLIIQACGRDNVDFLSEAGSFSRYIWLSRTPESLPIIESTDHSVITVPKIAKGENFLTLGYFLAVVTGKLAFQEPAINLTACENNIINGVQLVIPSRRLPWLLEHQITSFDNIENPQTLLMLISIAMRFAREGREGKSIGTTFIMSSPEDVAPYTWQLIFNPCAGYPEHLRNIFRDDFVETMRELSALDGAFLINPSGEVRSSAVFIATQGQTNEMESGKGARHHSACALTSHTPAIAIVLSESSGEVTIYQAGKKILHFT
jgi:diadenylate cyclase